MLSDDDLESIIVDLEKYNRRSYELYMYIDILLYNKKTHGSQIE
jgi:hypothetical protein